MDRKYNTLKEEVNQQNRSFKIYLKTFLLDADSWKLLMLISKQTDVYIFSGVIRNFLLGYFENRDLDIVIRDIDDITIPRKYLSRIELKRNNFGGYKLKIGMLNVDVWGMEETWGLKYSNRKSTPQNLIKTAFFNFSSIVYDFNEETFIYGISFLKFYETKSMDVLFQYNPNKPLCILNTMYYAKKYSFSIKYMLCQWIVDNYEESMNFKEVQQNHFGKILFSSQIIKAFVGICRDSLSKLAKNPEETAIFIDFH